MQDQYVGDVGDFGKYGLLRSLFRPPAKLGVVWWLYPDETHKSDGRHVDYLQRAEFRELDAELFDELGKIVRSGRRSIREVERRAVLKDAVFFSDEIEPGTARGEWFQRVLDHTADCDAVFLDPDNGLEIKSCKRGSPPAGKFVYFDEVASFAARGQSVVVYHHLCRRGTHQQQIEERTAQLSRFGKVNALLFRRYSPRVYFLLPKSPLPIDAFVEAWRGHVERLL